MKQRVENYARKSATCASVVAAVAAVMLGLFGAPRAVADPPPVDEPASDSSVISTLVAHRVTSDSDTVEPDAAGDTIVCTLSIDDPHDSNTKPGNVNVHVVIKCTGAVPSIILSAGLFVNNFPVGVGGPVFTSGGAGRTNAAALCLVSGFYHGTGDAFVTFPPGYTPQAAPLPQVQSPDQSIAC